VAEGQQAGQLVEPSGPLGREVAVAHERALDDLAVGRRRRLQRQRLADRGDGDTALGPEQPLALAASQAMPPATWAALNPVENDLGVLVPDLQPTG
jgi:hypothetical protein